MLGEVRDYADRLPMSGGTALYDSVLVALEHMLAERKKNPGYQYSVVAFTDGENNQGRNLDAFQAAYAAAAGRRARHPGVHGPVRRGQGGRPKAMVQTTGGRVFDARKTPLYAVFKDIRAYQ